MNKYNYLFVVQGYYDQFYGWEDLTQSEDKKEVRDNLREYNENETDYPHRMIERRELNEKR